jgi:hypothetical protein
MYSRLQLKNFIMEYLLEQRKLKEFGKFLPEFVKS